MGTDPPFRAVQGAADFGAITKCQAEQKAPKSLESTKSGGWAWLRPWPGKIDLSPGKAWERSSRTEGNFTTITTEFKIMPEFLFESSLG